MGMNNTNTIFEDGVQTAAPYGFSSMLRYHSERARVLAGIDLLPAVKLHAAVEMNNNRLNAWYWVCAALWQRFVWTPDTINAGVNDRWESVRNKWIDTKGPIYKD